MLRIGNRTCCAELARGRTRFIRILLWRATRARGLSPGRERRGKAVDARVGCSIREFTRHAIQASRQAGRLRGVASSAFCAGVSRACAEGTSRTIFDAATGTERLLTSRCYFASEGAIGVGELPWTRAAAAAALATERCFADDAGNALGVDGVRVGAGRAQRARRLGSGGDGSVSTGGTIVAVKHIVVLIFAHVVDGKIRFVASNIATTTG